MFIFLYLAQGNDMPPVTLVLDLDETLVHADSFALEHAAFTFCAHYEGSEKKVREKKNF